MGSVSPILADLPLECLLDNLKPLPLAYSHQNLFTCVKVLGHNILQIINQNDHLMAYKFCESLLFLQT